MIEEGITFGETPIQDAKYKNLQKGVESLSAYIARIVLYFGKYANLRGNYKMIYSFCILLVLCYIIYSKVR